MLFFFLKVLDCHISWFTRVLIIALYVFLGLGIGISWRCCIWHFTADLKEPSQIVLDGWNHYVSAKCNLCDHAIGVSLKFCWNLGCRSGPTHDAKSSPQSSLRGNFIGNPGFWFPPTAERRANSETEAHIHARGLRRPVASCLGVVSTDPGWGSTRSIITPDSDRPRLATRPATSCYIFMG